MIARSVGGNIQITSRPGLTLRLGEAVTLSVLKRLDGPKWAVAIHGRVYPARSDLPLEPGSVLRARVTASGRHLVLALDTPAPRAGAEALARQGLPAGSVHELMAASLLASGQPVTGETLEKMRAALSRTPVGKRRAARTLATLMDKGIDIAAPGTERLVSQIQFGQGGSSRQRYRGKDLPRSPAAVRRVLESLPASEAHAAGALAAYNHLRGRSQSWVVLPFVFSDGPTEYPGTLKLLYDPYGKKPLQMALTVAPDGGEDISFHAHLQPRSRVRLFCSDPLLRRRAERALGGLAAKLRNLGFEVDDIVAGGEDFDGFSPTGEGAPLRGVDTVG